MCKFSFKLSLILIELSFYVSFNDGLLLDHSLPCDFRDSVNISTGMIYSNKSIIFKGIEFAENQYAKVNYIWENGSYSIVEPYYRGCPCNEKPCVRLCCPYGSFVFDKTHDGEFQCREDEAARRIESEIIKENNQTEIISFDQHFGLLDRNCSKHFYADDFQITHVRIINFIN